jgi:hypothetical protein
MKSKSAATKNKTIKAQMKKLKKMLIFQTKKNLNLQAKILPLLALQMFYFSIKKLKF